tara:strand:- start:951 stop:1244 length:294 start_codon:yes stop_codon:yes gene_type:complete
MDQVVSETDNIELKEKCIEIQTGLTGNVVVNNDTLGSGGLLDGSNLYTVEGRLGDRSGSPVTSLTGATIVLPPTAFPPTGPPEADCPVECDDTTLQY